MQDVIAALVDETFSCLSAALATAELSGPPLVRTRTVERAIESLAGYAIGVFAAGVANRLSLCVNTAAAEQLRAALFAATGTCAAPTARVDVDALIDDDRVITSATLRAQVATRLAQGRRDATRIVAALVDAAPQDAAYLRRILLELACVDLVATRFSEQVGKVWARLHGGTTFVPAPKKTPSAPVTDNYCWMTIR